MAKQVTLTLKTLTAAVTELETIKEQISAHAGTQASRLAKAKAEALKSGVKVKIPTQPAEKDYESVTAWVDLVKTTADQALDEAVVAILRKSKDESAEGLSALRETFKAKADMAQAVQTMLVGLGVDGAKDVSIPTLKGTGRVGTGGGTKANSKGQQFYVILDGTRKDMASSQNKFSSVAWYHGADIGVPDCDTNKTKEGFKGCSSKALETFLKSKGAEITDGSPWSVTVSPTVTVGMDVNEAPSE